MRKAIMSQGLAFYLDGSSDKPALVLGHSLGTDYQIWDDVVRLLSNDWQVIRWDMPGHGQSRLFEFVGDSTQSNIYIVSLVDALLAGLDELGVTCFSVGGISLGAMVSMALAARAPERVISLAVFDSGPQLTPSQAWTEKAEFVRQNGLADLVSPTMQRWFTPDFQFGSGQARYERTVETFSACNPEGYARCCEVIANTDLWLQIEKIETPTLLAGGEEDMGMNRELLDKMGKAIPGTKVLIGAIDEPTVITQARHLACVEEPEQVSALLAELLRQTN